MTVNLDVNVSHPDDESLMREIREGSHDAFAVLVNRHSKRFYRIAHRLVFNKDDAEDIAQEAFLRLWHRRELWDPARGAKFTTWFYRVVINLCFDHKRKKRPLDRTENMEPVDVNPGQDAQLDARRKLALLDGFIRELPQRQQLALNLCFYEGLSHHEAAEIVGVKVKALQSLLMRAKTTLRDKANRYLPGGSV
jgi:RNA polymerase sigma-70 factor (ECF subfamily)